MHDRLYLVRSSPSSRSLRGLPGASPRREITMAAPARSPAAAAVVGRGHFPPGGWSCSSRFVMSEVGNSLKLLLFIVSEKEAACGTCLGSTPLALGA